MTDTEMILWIQNRVRSLMEEKGVKSEYRLFKDSGLAQSTVSSLLHSQTLPTLFTLQTLCDYLESRCPSFSLMKQKSSSAQLPKPKGKSFVIFCILPTGSSRHCLP